MNTNIDDAAAEFGRELRRLRIARGMTQGELADRVNVCTGTISRWERRGDVPLADLIRCAEALGADVRIEFSERAA